jgi:hypothetical protein
VGEEVSGVYVVKAFRFYLNDRATKDHARLVPEQDKATRFTLAEAETWRGKYLHNSQCGNFARIVRLVPKRRHAFDGLPGLKAFHDQAIADKARAEEREAVARYLESLGIIPGAYAPLVRSGAHRAHREGAK